MNRRSALLLTMLFGGLAARPARAQDAPRRPGGFSRARRVSDDLDTPPARTPTRDEDLEPYPAEAAAPSADEADQELPPAEAFQEPGREWREFDIAPYTRAVTNKTTPQTALIDWIFRRTGPAIWHDDRISALSASKARLKIYHTKKVIKQVAEVVDRFVNAPAYGLELTVRVVAAADTRWRYPHFARLKTVATGPQGQRVWTLSSEEAEMVRTQMQVYQGFTQLANKRFVVFNGQNMAMQVEVNVPYTGGLARDAVANLGFQPRTEQLVEGVDLRLSPLLTYDGDAIDLALELTASTVRSLHRTRVIAPREIGANEAILDVPEVASTRINTTIKAWPINQTLLISGGILPGILLSNKRGLFNLRIPGTVPTETELLVFLDARASDRPRTGGAAGPATTDETDGL